MLASSCKAEGLEKIVGGLRRLGGPCEALRNRPLGGPLEAPYDGFKKQQITPDQMAHALRL